jgi:hypothetical protein
MTDVNKLKSHQVAAFFDAPNAYGNMRGLARSLAPAFDQGVE